MCHEDFLFVRFMKKVTTYLYKIVNGLFELLYYLCIAGLAWIGMQVFVFATFKIPSNSMQPTLWAGDNVLVLKPLIGARLFNLFSASGQTTVYRMPGLNKIKRNDVLVFHFPYPKGWNHIEMDLLLYYIKRCVGLPGDTLSIEKCQFYLNGEKERPVNIAAEEWLTTYGSKRKRNYDCFPLDSIFGWSEVDFGPMYIPARGDSVVMSRTHYFLYRRLIEWEQQTRLQYRDSVCLLGDTPITGYRFRYNYYFMAGDNRLHSEDSRRWGLVPEEYIVGKAVFIWKSVDPYTGRFRRKRFMKVIR